MKVSQLTRDRLLETLRYEPNEGNFYWNVTQGTRSAGALAGNRHGDGYGYIKIDKVLYRTSRLVWLYFYSRWPKEHIDHIDGNTSNDRLVNLREASRSQNLGNRKKNKNNTSGFKGVSKRHGRYIAYVNKDGKRRYLGLFDTPENAHAAYMVAAVKLHGEFARAS